MLLVQLSKFVVVGSVGFVVDAGILHLLLPIAGPYNGRFISFAFAIVTTWLLNRNFVFKKRAEIHREGLSYLAVQSTGFLINFTLYSLLIHWHYLPFWSLVAASLVAMFWNFSGAKLIVFAQPGEGQETDDTATFSKQDQNGAFTPLQLESSIKISSSTRKMMLFTLIILIVEILFIPGKGISFDPDSQGYIDFYPTRTAIYPTFIESLRIVSSSYKFILSFQLLIGAFSACLLAVGFGRWTQQKKWAWIIWAGLVLNPVMLWFHYKVLTESLFCSLAILFIWATLRYIRCAQDSINLILIALIAGLSIAIRPASYFYLPAIVILLALFPVKRAQFFRSLLVATISVVLVLLVENMIFHSKHDQRQSLLPIHLFAKGMMLLPVDAATIDAAPQLNSKVTLLGRLNNEVGRMEGVKLRQLARTRLEVLYQYHLAPRYEREEQMLIGKELIARYPRQYAELTANHFVHLWSGFEVLSQEESDRYWLQSKNWQKPDFIDDANWHSVLVKQRRFFPLSPLRWLLIAEAVVLLLSIALMVRERWRKSTERNPNYLLAGFFALCCLGYSMLVALTGVATLRYVLTLAPFMLINFMLLVYGYGWWVKPLDDLKETVDHYTENEGVRGQKS